MSDRTSQMIGYTALGLIFFVCTLLTVRWTIDFVNWSQLEPEWAQVIGSVAALGVAIFVMSRQNKHAARLIVDVDMLTCRRRAAAVHAILLNSLKVAQVATSDLKRSRPDGAERERSTSMGFKIGESVVRTSREAINSVPTYELASHDMAAAVLKAGQIMHAFEILCEVASRHPGDPMDEPMQAQVEGFHATLKSAIAQFERGMAEL